MDEVWLVEHAAVDPWGGKALLIVVMSPQMLPFNQRIESRLPGIVEVVLNRFDVEGFANFLDRTL